MIGGRTFKYSSHETQFQQLLELLERLENLAYQAEREFWDLAIENWFANGYVRHMGGRKIATTILRGAEPICNEFLEKLAYLCGETHIALDWTGSQNTLYVGGTDLKLGTVKADTVKTQQVSGVNQIDVTMSASSSISTDTPRTSWVPSGVAVIAGLRNKINWLQHWLWNSYSSALWAIYEDALDEAYTWALNLIDDNIGPNFATPLTAFYSVAETGLDYYDRPRIGAAFESTNLLTLYNYPVYDEASVPLTGGAPGTGFHAVGAGDWIHVVRLGLPGYSHWEDRVYVCTDVTETGIVLYAPTDEALPEVISDPPAERFGDLFLIRKIRGATET